MGMWVEQFNSSTPVQYSHNWKFCQYGCLENYYTAHYQSPRQMICLWDKLARGRAQCCVGVFPELKHTQIYVVRQLAYSTELLGCINYSKKQYNNKRRRIFSTQLYTQALSLLLSVFLSQLNLFFFSVFSQCTHSSYKGGHINIQLKGEGGSFTMC